LKKLLGFFHKDAKDFVKTLIYNIDGNPVGVMVRGDRDVNETKLRKFLNAQSVELADPDMVVNATGAQIGFAGPINIKCPVYADEEVMFMQNFIVGANKTGYHYTNVNNKDFTITGHGDLRNIMEGDICPKCGGRIHFSHGIEVGNTFKLGTKYSKAMDLQYLDANNTLQYVWMGSYGIGPGRAMAALAEQNADENGINWPADIAPYQVAIVIISMKDEKQVETANQIYDALTAKGVEVILDDRDERPGVKFKDMELIGIPYRITVGKGIAEGNVEWKTRTSEKQNIAIDKAAEYALSVLKK
jgi:prolyl-tRNA synthetase